MAAFGAVPLAGDSQGLGALSREFDGAWRQVRRERGLPLTTAAGDAGRGPARPDRVFHATLSVGADEIALSDDEWSQAARLFVEKMGFANSERGADCAWFAVHHGASKQGNDHVHIAVNMVREDGRRADLHRSKMRTAQAGAEVAREMGREVVFDNEVSSAASNISRAEIERASREGREPDRVVIRRRLAGAAWQATSEAEFVRGARTSGLLVRPRYGDGGVTRVVGYSVALDSGTDPVWFAPSKLDRSLGLPVLRERYGWDYAQQMDAVAAWRESGASKGAGERALRLPGADEIGRVRGSLTEGRGDVAWRRAAIDASAMLGAWSTATEGPQGGYLGQASDAFARTARPDRSTTREKFMETAQTVMTVAAAASKTSTTAQLALIMQMMRLAEAVASAAAAERDARAAKAAYTQAVVPLNIQAGLLDYEVGQEKLRNADPEVAEMLMATEAITPKHLTGSVNYSRLSPSTVQALTGQARSVPPRARPTGQRARQHPTSEIQQEPSQER